MRDPTLPPMREHLPFTPADRCRALLLGVVSAALVSGEDWEWITRSPVFELYCLLIGLDREQVLQLRLKFCRNELDPHDFWMSSLDGTRRDRDGAEETTWQSWPALAR